ncbi:MAG: hypothetical protein L0Y42_11090 [Phycisphaerales bacterium]|nr:hypothetical protein [Phycisphaerales bacterium]
MSALTLACGPYFDETGFLVSVVLFLAVKPLAYFAFIQAFRYRVSRAIPMRMGQAIGLTALRAGLGIGLVSAGAGAMYLARDWGLMPPDSWFVFSWVFLYAERLFSWWFVGWRGAGLRGRRLVGWIISGTLINAAFDVAMVMGLLEGWMPPAGIVAGIGMFILALHVVGRRDSLKRRFASGTTCHTCGYSLMGNLSGRCPECGASIQSHPAAVVPV